MGKYLLTKFYYRAHPSGWIFEGNDKTTVVQKFKPENDCFDDLLVRSTCSVIDKDLLHIIILAILRFMAKGIKGSHAVLIFRVREVADIIETAQKHP